MNDSELDSTMTDETTTPVNPFPGLRPFRTDEDFIFFGRDDQTGELLSRLRRHRFLAVVGSSGSGKSSLVRAGLLPALYGGTIVDVGSSWEVAIMRPSGNPLFHLSRALCEAELYDVEAEDVMFHLQATLRRSRRGLIEAVRQSSLEDGTNLLLVVDQFEEIFRFGQGGSLHTDAAVDFIDLLLQASREEDAPVYVVITMRADFLGDCAQFPGLVEAINDGKYLIPRLGRDQLRAAIEGPVRVAGAELAQRLAHRLLNDVGDDHDQLPVLQHALMRTWDCWVKDHTEGEPVDLRHFEATGGFREALSRHADEVYEGLPDDRHRRVAEKLFKTITEHDPDERGVRRPTRLSDAARITGADESEIITVVEAFRKPGCTFLTPYAVPLASETIIDVSHESFMRVWRRLERWVEEESQAARIYRRLADTAQLQAEGKAGLYRDPDLRIASSWRDNDRPRPAWGEQYHPGFERAMAFLEESERAARAEADAREAAREREVEQAKKLAEAERVSARNFKRFATGMAILALIAIALSAWAFWLEGRARESKMLAASNARKAEASRVIAEAAQAEALEAKSVAENLLARSRHEQGVTWLERARLLLQENRSLEAKILAAKALGYGEAPGKDDAFREENPVLLKRGGPEWRAAEELLTAPEFSPSWKSPARFHHEDLEVLRVRYSRDGRFLASATDKGNVTVWDASSGEEIVTLRQDVLEGNRSNFLPDFHPDGSLLAAPGGETVLLWKIPSGEALPRLASPVGEVVRVCFSPEGTLLAVGGARGVSLCDYQSGENVPLRSPATENVPPGLESGIDDLSWNHDGSLLVVLSGGAAQIWNVGERTQSGSPLACEGAKQVRFSPDGSLLVAAGSSAHLWKVEGAEPLDTSGLVPEGGSFHDIAFHPAGTLLALGDQAGKLHLWDFGRAQKIGTLDQEAVCHSLAFSPDRKVLASSGNDGRIRFWNLFTEDGMVSALGDRRSYRGYYDLTDQQRMGPDLAPRLSRVAISPDGTLIASAGERWHGFQGGVRVWEVGTGEVVWALPIDGANVVKFSPDGSYLAIAGRGQGSGSLLVYEVESWTLAHSVPVRGRADFSPDGKILAVMDATSIVLYDLARGRELPDVPHSLVGASLIAFSPDGSKFAAAGQTQIALRNWPAGSPMGLSVGLPANARDLAFSPDGTRLAVLMSSQMVRFWDTTGVAANLLADLSTGVHEPTALAFSPDGQMLAVAGSQETRVWDTRAQPDFVELATLPTRATTDLVFGPDGTTLFTVGGDQSVWTWEVPKRRLAVFEVEDRVTSVAHSPDGRRLFCGRSDGKLSILDTVTGEELDLVDAHDGEVFDVAVSHDGELLATTGGRHGVRVWNVRTHAPLHLLLHTGVVTSVRFSPDGTRLVAGGDWGGVNVWDVATGSLVYARSHDGKSVSSVRYSPDGQVVASAGSDGTVFLWVATSDREPTRIDGQCVAFHPAGRLLATGLRDGTIRLWTPAGDPVDTLEGNTRAVVRLGFSSDGTRLASGEQDGTTRLWDVSSRLPVAVFRAGDHRGLQSVPFSFSPGGSFLAVPLAGRLGNGVAIQDARQPIPDASRYVSYLDWYRIDGRDVLPRVRKNLYRPIALALRSRQPHSHVAILTGEEPLGEQRRALFREYLRSRNWDSAAAVLKKLPKAASERERELLASALLGAARVEAERGLTSLASRLLQLAETVTGETPGIWRERAVVLMGAGKTEEALVALARGVKLARAGEGRESQALRGLLVDRFRIELARDELEGAQEALDAIWALPDAPGANGRHVLAREYVHRYVEELIEKADGADLSSIRDELLATAILQIFLAAYSTETIEHADLMRLASLFPGFVATEVVLVERDARWKFFDSGGEPAPRWQYGDFDDRAWESGPAPLGFGDQQATLIRRNLTGTGPSSLTFYFRHSFDLDELPGGDELLVRVARDDAVAVYLNGQEIVRDNLPAGLLSSRTLSVSSMGGAAETEVHEFRIPTHHLRTGTNLLAAEVHQSGPGSSDAHFVLSLSTVTTPSGGFLRSLEGREEDEFRGVLERAVSVLPASVRAELRPALTFAWENHQDSTSLAPPLARDPEAWRVRRRVQQSLARHAAAEEAARRESVLRMADGAAPDWARIVELAAALRAHGEVSTAEELLRSKTEGDASPSADAVRLLFDLGLEVGRDPVEIVDRLPKGVSYAGQGSIGDWTRTVRAMREDGVVRINCGGGEYTSPAGVAWAGDRHFVSGTSYVGALTIRGTDDDPLYQSERWFSSGGGELPAYRVPLGSGRYRVTLHFAEILRERASAGGRVFDVLLEGEPVLEDYDPARAVGFATADRKSVEVDVTDGWLDVAVISRTPQSGRFPKIAALEIERLE